MLMLAWVNNCVGLENRRYFLLFIFYLMIAVCYNGITIASIWNHHIYVKSNITFRNNATKWWVSSWSLTSLFSSSLSASTGGTGFWPSWDFLPSNSGAKGQRDRRKGMITHSLLFETTSLKHLALILSSPSYLLLCAMFLSLASSGPFRWKILVTMRKVSWQGMMMRNRRLSWWTRARMKHMMKRLRVRRETRTRLKILSRISTYDY